ncbi:LCP family protein [Rummeliibacillus sp. G93]|uniref:LCP family protein n=1 Tax=Rummeliibacillus TaxID=648802 RepID=UPI00116D565C|nr:MULTISPECIES: LCP family protein [Rummeliibacillus]MBB5169197.1 LCP family protein required for cell wall assembly [Rummeliibacillus stabekisii]UQW96059.1 LCP family protein [Rummeliibacillus sp. G93]GEL03458.1 regulatory protein MsrR [Rummeliibacillus stabekisii]
MKETRHKHIRKKRKLRKGRVFFLLIVVVLIAIGAFAFTQYKAGLNLAKTSGDIQKIAKFNGDPQTKKNVENILLLGVDSRGEANSRTDSMILVSVNKDTNKIKMVSFMRDIYANIPGYQSYKLNTAYYLGKVDLLKKTIQNMFDVEINHYALIDFKSFEKLVDIVAPNGVNVYVDHDMSENIGVSLKKGEQTLNGKELLGFSRFRHDNKGDFGRVDRQQKALEALKKEAMSPRNFKNYPKLLGAIQGYVQSDLTDQQELALMLSIIKGGNPDITRLTIPVQHSYEYGYYPQAGSVLNINIEQNQQALDKFLDS